jgi:hypothetical protein
LRDVGITRVLRYSFTIPWLTAVPLGTSVSVEALARMSIDVPTAFMLGERVAIDTGLGEPETGEIVGLWNDGRALAVRFHGGVVGDGDMPLVWVYDDHYELPEGGSVKVRKLM